ncbi:MAG: nickel-responsive regulator 1 [Thermoplasmata archaeon]|nr:nickel-responsive regulator 1 [Thermoplasmata archaeon]
MPIVSVSLTEKNLEVLERIQGELGLSGRSEAIRACLRSADSEVREREALDGDVEGVLIVVHQTHRNPQLDDVRHTYQDLITTQIHSHMKRDKCLDVFIIRGEGQVVRNMISAFKRDENLEYVKFVHS